MLPLSAVVAFSAVVGFRALVTFKVDDLPFEPERFFSRVLIQGATGEAR